MKKSKILIGLLAVTLIVTFVFMGCAKPSPSPSPSPKPTAPPVQAKKLVFNTHDVETTPQSAATRWYLEEVAKRSGGLVTFEYHWAGELAGGADELSALRGGALDLAAPPPAYTPNDTPLLQLPNATRVTNSTEVAMRKGLELFWKSGEVSALLEAEAKAHNVKLLIWCPMEYSLVSKSKVTKLADLKGLKLRSVGIFEPKLLTAYGAIPVSVLPQEWYEALARGTIDAIPMVNESIISFKLNEVAKYKSFHSGAILSNPIMINLNTYGKLPDSVKAILDDMKFREEATEKFIQIWKEGTDKNMAELRKTMEFVTPDQADQQKLWDDWVKVTVSEYPGAVEKAGKGAEGKKVLNRWLELVTGQGLEAWQAKLK